MAAKEFALKTLRPGQRYVEHHKYPRLPAFDPEDFSTAASMPFIEHEVYRVMEIAQESELGTKVRIAMAVVPDGGGPKRDQPMLYMSDMNIIENPFLVDAARMGDAIRKIVRLITSPRAKERNKGRRMAKRVGWLR